jgi:hypothetical protein
MDVADMNITASSDPTVVGDYRARKPWLAKPGRRPSHAKLDPKPKAVPPGQRSRTCRALCSTRASAAAEQT